MSEYKAYTGIGSRETPDDILELMRWFANNLYFKGYTLRSGGAPGADQAFEFGLAGADQNRSLIQERSEIYLPWGTFEKDNRSWLKPKLEKPQSDAYHYAAKYHPGWKFLTPGAMTFHARNIHQVFGPDVNNPIYSDFIICWTKNAKGGGGTGQALRAAKGVEVPVYDLADESVKDMVIDWFYDA